MQNHINEEINSFNEELAAFKNAFSSVTEKKELIGSRQEFDSLYTGVNEISSVVKEYKTTMDENKNECKELRNRVLFNFKHVDEASLLKEKFEDKRYTEVFRTRKLDPVSANQRKDLRFQVNNLGNILSDINADLDNKWEELQRHKNKSRQPRGSANQSQQIYKTIEAIEKISSNLSSRLKTLTLEAGESYMITMNTSRHASHTIPKNNSSSPSSTVLSLSKMNRLREMLSKRDNTPVRRPKRYSQSETSGFLSESSSVLPTPHPKLNPKAASTPAVNHSFGMKQIQSKSNIMRIVSEEPSYAKSEVQKLKDYAPPSFLNQETPKFLPVPPKKSPVTPMLPGQGFETPERLQNINKNLFGQVPPPNQSIQTPGSNTMQTPPAAFKGFSQQGTAVSKSSFGKLSEATESKQAFSQSGFPVSNTNLSFGFGKDSATSQSAFTTTPSTVVPLKNTSFAPITLDKVSNSEFGVNVTSSGGFSFGSTQEVCANKLGSSIVSGSTFGSTSSASLGSPKSSAEPTSTSGGLFNAPRPSTETTSTSGGLFDASTSTSSGLFSAPKPSTETTSTSGGLFGASTSSGLFVAPKPSTETTSMSGGLFGASTSSGLFGAPKPSTETTSTSGSLFGASTSTSGGLFGAPKPSTETTSTSGGLFGAPKSSGGLFGSSSNGGSLFGAKNETSNSSGGLFGNSTTGSSSGGLFGQKNSQPTTQGSSAGSGFGGGCYIQY